MNDTYDYLVKLIIIGDSGVGKSSILYRFVDNDYNDSYISTIGVDFKIKTLEINGKIFKLQIWDTAGQERFRSILSSYYRGANGVILTYSSTDRDTFDHINTWYGEIKKYAPETSITILCSTKIDDKKHIKISNEEGKKYALEHNMKFIETSARDNINIDQLFLDLVISITTNTILENKSNKAIDFTSNITLNKKNKCC